jgi:hypothetical protein
LRVEGGGWRMGWRVRVSAEATWGRHLIATSKERAANESQVGRRWAEDER